MGKFNLPLQTPEQAYNALLGSENQVEEISLFLLDEVENQPFPINEEKIDQIADSILSVGLLEPVLVRSIGERYEILSGRHRYRACKKLGRDKIKCIVMNNLDDNKARYVLITTNTERNNDYAPSVYAKAYAEEVEILKKLGHNNPTVAAVAERHGVNRKQIQRYIRLNSLIPELLGMVDDQSIPFMVGVELSFFSSPSQRVLYDFLKSHKEINITVNAARELRSCGELSDDVLNNFFFPTEIGNNDKPEPKKVKSQKSSTKQVKTLSGKQIRRICQERIRCYIEKIIEEKDRSDSEMKTAYAFLAKGYIEALFTTKTISSTAWSRYGTIIDDIALSIKERKIKNKTKVG